MEAFEFDDATAKKVEQFNEKLEKTQADIIKYSIAQQQPVFLERDAFLKGVDKFWFNALFNCPAVAVYIDDEDRDVFESLTEIRVERNLDDPREATVHFDFAENAYFSDKTLTKVFKVNKDAPSLGSDDFDFAASVSSDALKINWKSDEKNLSKKNPTNADPAEGELEDAVPGSFFSSFFEHQVEGLASSIGDNIINEFYPRAIEYYTGEADDELDMYDGEEFDDEEDDDDEEDEEDEEDDDREIDLEEEEQRQTKKSKK